MREKWVEFKMKQTVYDIVISYFRYCVQESQQFFTARHVSLGRFNFVLLC